MMNKKFDRLKQWTGERMGREAKTSVSDEFQSLETEMQLRYDGTVRLQKSMNGYIKTMSKRSEGEDKDKTYPVANLGGTMVAHGEEFDADSEFGQCLIMMGRTNERIARIQESYVMNATSSWLESLERSMVQMKEYQAARKKLESRRLAYDASLTKMQKAKKEDFRVEEEFRSQKAKYEESTEDCFRRMQDIREAEMDSTAGLTAFLEAEFNYYDKCRDVLAQLRQEWPAAQAQQSQQAQQDDDRSYRAHRSRSNTTHSLRDRVSTIEENSSSPEHNSRIKHVASSQPVSETRRALPGMEYSQSRPTMSRTPTFEGPTQLHSDAPARRLSRVASDSYSPTSRQSLRPASRVHSYDNDSSYDMYSRDRSVSPTASGGTLSHRASSQTLNAGQSGFIKKGPPPPPPSRTKKPPPPPPPMKRNIYSAESRYA